METILKNKAGKAKKANLTPLWVILAVGLTVGALFMFGVIGDTSRTPASQCSDSTTSLSFSTQNFYTKSTSVTATPYGRIDNGPITNLSSVSSFGIGTQITDYFVSASNYIDAEQDSFTVDCGMTQAPVSELKATDNPSTFVVKDDSGTTLTNAASNGSVQASSTSGNLELQLRIGSSQDLTTGDMIIVVEYDNDTQADSISMTGATEVDVPELYSDEASNSLVKAFRIPAVEDGATETFTTKIQPESGETLGAVESAVRFTRYSEQAAEDTDGTLIVGVEDSDGTAIYEDTGDYDISIA